MNLRDLEYVVSLAETLHFGRAASRCHVTQPTLSMQIARLETELGATLFERGKRKVMLTETGRRVAALARRVLDGVREIQDTARNASAGLSGPFYLGVIPTVGPYLLPHIIPILRRAHPGVELYLREEITERLVSRLDNGELDAAILSLPIPDANLEHATFCTERFMAALPKGHALAAHDSLNLKDFSNETILLLEEGNCMRDQTLALCRGARPLDRNEYRASSVESLRQMVGAGMGCTFLPELSTTGLFRAASPIEIRPFVDPAPVREIVLAWRRTYPKADIIRALAKRFDNRLKSVTGIRGSRTTTKQTKGR